MSDHQHVEPENQSADRLATSLFVLGILGILSFIAVIFYFVIL